VFGLLAGLRAASNDVCCALPVDCPLVTPELLRALADARAVPQTGPLPGSYAKEHLPELEERVSRGELSLRGVNPNVLDVDAKLLTNVNTRMDLIEAAIADWAHARDDVRAVLVVGSRARTEAPADRWSDLDVVLFLDDPRVLAEDASWVEEFGTPVLTFLEATGFGERVERRVLYETGEDVDFPMLQASQWRELAATPEARVLLARGQRLLHDELGLEDELADVVAPPPPALPDDAALRQLASDFWYHALWTARKLRRGEVFTAIDCLDGYMKARLVTLLEWHARAVDPSVDTWHGGRFLERWADPGALAALELAFAHYDVRDVARALWATIDLWQALEEETARRLGLEVGLDHADLRRRVAEVVPKPGTSPRLSS
jgi:aminoglycoside 6-adenylyltransferase